VVVELEVVLRPEEVVTFREVMVSGISVVTVSVFKLCEHPGAPIQKTNISNENPVRAICCFIARRLFQLKFNLILCFISDQPEVRTSTFILISLVDYQNGESRDFLVPAL
jgi:hypothetical protein